MRVQSQLLEDLRDKHFSYDDYRRKGINKEIVKKNCLAEPLWTKELDYGERRDGVVDEEVLICGLNKDKPRVA